MTPSLPKNHLIVFGRYPEVGRVKTRLIPALGPAGAAALQKRLTERTIKAARRAAAGLDARITFCHAGGDRERIRQWLDAGDIASEPQTAGDIGRRMGAAMDGAFRRGAQRVVLVGTDIPDVNADRLRQAFDRLRQCDVVLGPSTDGGYWLIGLSRPADLFDGITWSSPAVLDQTLARTHRRGMTVAHLDPLADVDTSGDLTRASLAGMATTPYLSVIIPTLNEAACIAAAIAGAATPDTEIIVTDGGSTDRTIATARSGGARIVTGARGRARQQNRGAAAARGEVLLFLHADTRLPQGFVAHIFETLMDRRVVLGAFRFKTDIPTTTMRRIAWWTNQRAERLKLPYGDQGLFLRRRDFNAGGGFPDVPIAEDLYLVRRMAKQGRIALCPAAAVTSGRRWQRLGPLRTTIINTIIALACLAGVAPRHLAPLYGRETR